MYRIFYEKTQDFDICQRTNHVETVVQLSRGEIDSKKVRVEFSLEDMDMSVFQKGATYEQIKAYVKEQTGLSVSSLYIAQVKKSLALRNGCVIINPRQREPRCHNVQRRKKKRSSRLAPYGASPSTDSDVRLFRIRLLTGLMTYVFLSTHGVLPL